MEPSSGEIPFYAEFGKFKEGYNREEAEVGMSDAFRARQKERRERRLKQLLLGSGIGHSAKQTVYEGLYQPQTALNFSRHGTSAVAAEGDSGKVCGLNAVDERDDVSFEFFFLPDMALFDISSSSVMGQFAGGKAVEVRNMLEVQQQLCDNMKVVDESIARLCDPLVFDNILESLSIALRVVEEGDAHILVTLPMQGDGSAPIEGAEAVMKYAQENLIPFAAKLVNILYATEWMLQYTMTFVNSLVARDEIEALARMQILAHCVRWLGKINLFVALVVVLELASERYSFFVELRTLAECHVNKNINRVEAIINDVLLLPFPRRRKALAKRVEEISERLRLVFGFLSDIETKCIPGTRFEANWKNDLFSWVFEKIHYFISPGYFFASLGFIDESLYTLLPKKARRVPLRSALRAASFCLSGTPESGAKISVATLVMIERVYKKMTFQQIGVAVKETASHVIGLQLCMGARYVLLQCGAEHDAMWGFSMNYACQSHDVFQRAELHVARFTEALCKQTVKQMDGNTKLFSSLASL